VTDEHPDYTAQEALDRLKQGNQGPASLRYHSPPAGSGFSIGASGLPGANAMSSTPIPAQASAPKASTFRFDLVAGLTAAAVVLPKAMAYASVAGLPVAVGLYTAFIPMAIYALLGTSRVLSVSSTTTIAILAGTQLGQAVPDGDPARLVTATATLTLLVGAALVAAQLLKLGFVANFMSTPVLTGFKAGIGLVIVLDQVPKLLGIHITKHGFFSDAVSIVNHSPETSTITLMVALATFAVLIAMERLWPHSPAPLVAVAGGITAAWFLGLEKSGVSIVGLIPQGFPSLTPPDPALVEALLPGALGIALMSFTESIAAGRAFARADDPPVNANRELLATGAANLGGAFFGIMPAGGGTSQTAVVRAAGGQSQVASLVTAGAALATMLFLAPILGLMPNATLAAVVIVYSVGLIKPSEFRAIRSVRTMEFRWALVACIGVLLLGTLRGIVVAIIVSMIGLASQSAYPRVYVIGRKRGEDVLRPLSPEHGDDETFEGLLILRPEGRLFFVNAQEVGRQIQALVAKYQPRVLVLDMSRVSDIEYSALQMLIEGERRMTESGVEVWLAALNPGVLATVRNTDLDKRLGRERMLFNARTAIERYQARQATGGTAA
jgi:high affinity sulfate transporter 1